MEYGRESLFFHDDKKRGGNNVNITKYGISFLIGYGFGGGLHDSYSSPHFITFRKIVARSKITTESSRQMNWKPECIYGVSCGYSVAYRYPYPVYLVYDEDSETWKEYFSGMTIELAYDDKSGWEYDVDCPDICYGVLSALRPRECSATEFAENVSKYSDKEIQEMVGHLRKLNNDAFNWKKELDALVKAVKDERAKKEADLSSVESKLVSGFGKYGNPFSVDSQQSSDMQQTPKTHPDSHLKQPPTQEDKLQWIRQGRCAYCGGEFKGLFSKVCRKCGKAKNYR